MARGHRGAAGTRRTAAMNGHRCPKCKALNTTIVDSRPVRFWRRRRHHCITCEYRFSTVQIVYTKRLRLALFKSQPPPST